MNSPSLGQQLSRLIALKKPTSDIRRDTGAQHRMQRRAVARFFEDAKDHILTAIQAGLRPEPFVLGTSNHGGAEEAARAMQTYQWSYEQRAVPVGNPFRAQWDEFVTWARSQDLEVFFTDDHDGVGVRSWKNLCVQPDSAKVGPPPDIAEDAVCLPKDVLARFGSAQAYIEHLQQQAGHR